MDATVAEALARIHQRSIHPHAMQAGQDSAKKTFEPFKRDKNAAHQIYDTKDGIYRKQKCELKTLHKSNVHVPAFNRDPKYSLDLDHKVPHMVSPNLVFAPGDEEKNQLCTPHERNMLMLDPFALVKMCVTSNSDLKAIWKPLGSELQDRFINAFSLYLNCKFELIQG